MHVVLCQTSRLLLIPADSRKCSHPPHAQTLGTPHLTVRIFLFRRRLPSRIPSVFGRTCSSANVPFHEHRGSFSVLGVISCIVLATGKEREGAQWLTRSCFSPGKRRTLEPAKHSSMVKVRRKSSCRGGNKRHALLQSLCFLPVHECGVSTKEV
jgi:hypothetical protein